MPIVGIRADAFLEPYENSTFFGSPVGSAGRSASAFSGQQLANVGLCCTYAPGAPLHTSSFSI